MIQGPAASSHIQLIRGLVVLGLLAVAITLFACATTGPLSPLPIVTQVRDAPLGPVPFDLARLKQNWRARIAAMRARDILPIIDIESSYREGTLPVRDFARAMDEHGIALMALSPSIPRDTFLQSGRQWSDDVRRLVNADPWRFIPTTTGGAGLAWSRDPALFLLRTRAHAQADGYPLMGEFEFRHYPSPREIRRGETGRDVTVPIDGRVGNDLFAYAEQTGIPFQIHYEIEDRLLPALERMLARYPRAKVIWCHLAQVRYRARAPGYEAATVRRLIETYPNLYFDLAFGGPDSVYPDSGEYHARIWDRNRGSVHFTWAGLIRQYPWRFLAALDLGGDRLEKLPDKARNLRHVINDLHEDVREIVAYKAAWKLLFNEAI